MIISARERIILQILLENIEEEMTIKGIAEHVNVSERTIHRDLKNIEDILEGFHLKLNKKAGVGVKIIGNPNDIYQLRVSILKQDYVEYTPDERILVALCTLLDHQEPIKLFSLAKELGVTTATVSNDLDKLEPTIEKFNLRLLRKRGYGIELVGTEEDKRKAIRSLISDRFDVPEFLKMVKENIQKKSSNKIDSISERLLGLVQKEKLLRIENIIEDINEQLPYPLADSSYVGLVVHIALAMERIQRGENISFKEDYLNELSKTKEFEFATQIVERLERTFDIVIPEEEIGYITMHLRGAKVRYDNKVGIKDENVEVAMLVRTLITNVEKLLHTTLLGDSLFQGLLAHLQPTLYRLDQKMRISNPLLENIKEDYAELFAVVQKAVELTLVNRDVPEEEIGYLVLHFGSALNDKKITKDLKLLIICSSGIGTSKMLAAKIINQIPSLSEVKTASVFELKNISIDEYDAILSTIPLEDISRDYLVVNPILSDKDLEEVKSYLQKNSGHLLKEAKVIEAPKQKCMDFQSFLLFTEKSQILSTVLKEMHIWDEGVSLGESLKRGLEVLKQQGSILSNTEVYEALEARAEIGGLAIPETNLALYHTSSNQIESPSFDIIDLPEMVSLRAMNGANEMVKRVLLLLAPLNASPSVMEVLSFLSASIIESERSIDLFNNGNKEELLNFISSQFLRHHL
ncbi:BglG family transcription antiterminator [Cytobacillus oceanisediminis]|uniref:Transcription antiterminator n=1 Tax=Niallia alba TaxID=2729105 RepID=A0A7Y0PL18_9BACI|nr:MULTISPECIES: BglG family transcription antiterminator [Bacillaceae]MBZ9534954.1 BglG family transcription antiterminator [Cytobacillus oceanisediminis]NMO75856.1 transcription antiterminator [Niallia alba]UTI43653.1 transcription antiterminator [Niallia sp. RD1]